jgi:phosphoribosylformimino-5-aminoimidazole carboxamide ribotide isomerase
VQATEAFLVCPLLQLHGPAEDVEAKAKAFRQAGASWVQVIDLDAATGGRNQWPQLTRLLDGSLHIQFGGGIRSMTQVQQLLDLGVERVIVGTQAILNPLWAKELAIIFPGRIILGLDTQGRRLLVSGRTEETDQDIVEAAKALDGSGLAAFLYADVSGSPDMQVVAALRLAAPLTPLFVAGEFDLEGLERLKELGAAGAVPGPSGDLDLQEAFQAHPAPGRRIIQVLQAREERVLDAGGETGSDEEAEESDEEADEEMRDA